MSGEGGLRGRPAAVSDVAAITRIYNQGIADGTATFETRLREDDDVMAWFGRRFPIVVVESDGEVIAFASTSEYRPRECYSGIAEFSVYVDREHRGQGAGRMAMETLSEAARRAGFWKLVSRVFVENLASRALLARRGISRGWHLRAPCASRGCVEGRRDRRAAARGVGAGADDFAPGLPAGLAHHRCVHEGPFLNGISAACRLDLAGHVPRARRGILDGRVSDPG